MPKSPIVLLTRPKADSEWFASQLGQAEYVISPAFEVRQIRGQKNPADYGAVVFSSQNAIRAAAQDMELAGLNAFAVGDHSAKLAGSFGMNAISAKGNANDLVALIAKRPPEGKLLYLHGQHTRGNIGERLITLGLETDSVVVYQQNACAMSQPARQALSGDRAVILPIFSPRTARLLSSEMAGAWVKAPLTLIAMSDAVSRSWNGPRPNRIVVAQSPTAKQMLKETLKWVG